eukprot:4560270-Pleurochrysis_carterae.AAC.2
MIRNAPRTGWLQQATLSAGRSLALTRAWAQDRPCTRRLRRRWTAHRRTVEEQAQRRRARTDPGSMAEIPGGRGRAEGRGKQTGSGRKRRPEDRINPPKKRKRPTAAGAAAGASGDTSASGGGRDRASFAEPMLRVNDDVEADAAAGGGRGGLRGRGGRARGRAGCAAEGGGPGGGRGGPGGGDDGDGAQDGGHF